MQSFLDFTLFLNLSGYVSAKISLLYPLPENMATLLLYRRIRDRKSGWFGLELDIDYDIVLALIKRGADVSWKEGELHSIWELYMTDLYKQLTERDPTLPSIMLEMLSSGVDPRIRVNRAEQSRCPPREDVVRRKTVRVREAVTLNEAIHDLCLYYMRHAVKISSEFDRAVLAKAEERIRGKMSW